MSSHASLTVLLPFAVFAPSLSLAQSVTFNKDIAPIIYNNCSSCHRPGEAAPFSLLSYQDVSKRGSIIASVTQSRFMPPWKADVTSYPFRDERRLKDAEIALIQDWVKHGMPEGKASDAPAATEIRFGLDAWRAGPDRRDARRVSRSAGWPGYLSQHRGAARPEGRQMDHRDRYEAVRAFRGPPRFVFRRPERQGPQPPLAGAGAWLQRYAARWRRRTPWGAGRSARSRTSCPTVSRGS